MASTVIRHPVLLSFVAGYSLLTGGALLGKAPTDLVFVGFHQPYANISYLSGQGTSRAVFEAKISLETALAWCRADLAEGKECTQARFIKEGYPKQFSVHANCSQGRIEIQGMSTYLRTDYGWRDEIAGADLDGSNASGEAVVQAQFELLCPGVGMFI